MSVMSNNTSDIDCTVLKNSSYASLQSDINIGFTSASFAMTGLSLFVSTVNIVVFTRPLMLRNSVHVLLATIEGMNLVFHIACIPFWILQFFPEFTPETETYWYVTIAPFIVTTLTRLFIMWTSVIVCIWCLITIFWPRIASMYLTHNRASCAMFSIFLCCSFPVAFSVVSFESGYVCSDKAFSCSPDNVIALRLSKWAANNSSQTSQLIIFNYMMYILLPTIIFFTINCCAFTRMLFCSKKKEPVSSLIKSTEIKNSSFCILIILLSGYLVCNVIVPLTSLVRHAYFEKFKIFTFFFCPVFIFVDILLRYVTNILSIVAYYFFSGKYRVTLYNLIVVNVYLIFVRKINNRTN